MSLINKMLQDLDARGTAPGEALPGPVKPVERERRGIDRRVVVACVGGVTAIVAVGLIGTSLYPRRHAVQPTPMAAQANVAAPATLAPVVALPAVALPPVATPPVAASPAPGAATAVATGTPPRTIAPLEPDGAEARAARVALNRELGARGGAPAPEQAAAPRPHRTAAPEPAAPDTGVKPEETARPQPAQGRNADGRQRAESEYRRALASLQDGRMTDTVAALESALRLEPAHEAARQTLVGLLVEAGRQDEAMRQAQVGLTLDPRQPALAMLLARLQMEHGGNGIDTLTRTLPYAGNNADYRAFYAAALTREGRHREAAEQYVAALRVAPSNGVWWMGLGMSLQADRRDGEALGAFQKARAAGMPSQELQEFVERRVQQLGQ